MSYYWDVLRKYAEFDGRARRSEYWYFVLFNYIIIFGLSIIEGLLGFFDETDQSFLASIYQLVVLIPYIAVSVRRMHDVNKSGWFILIPIYNFILAVTEGTRGDNKYGSDPKRAENK